MRSPPICRSVAWLPIAFLCFWIGIAAAQLPVPTLSGRIVDQANLLSPSTRSEIEALLLALERDVGSQIVVLTIPSTTPESIEQFSIRVAEAWKIGRKGVDDGVILVIAPGDRAARIEVGYGLEGAIPDALANRIIEDYMIPRFREAQFAEGIRDAVQALMQAIRKEPLPEPVHRPGDAVPSGALLNTLIFIIFLVPIIGAVLKSIFGPFAGSLASGLLWGGLGSLFLPFWAAAVLAIVSFFLVLASGWSTGFSPYGSRTYRGGYSGGGFGGGGGGGFSGGGGTFGGGGASGRW